MPLKVSEFPIPIGLRVSPAQAEKLDLLAAKTGRQRNAMLRYLIEHAQFSGVPEVHIDLGNTDGNKDAELEGAAHAG
jgi:hypothetical protein